MFGQIPFDIIILFMLYAAGAVTAAIASLYLLLRRGNAFAPDIVTPVRLRRWTAVFFAVLAIGHLWYMPTVVFTSSDDIMLSMLIGALLDCMTVVPLAIIIMLCMLQDRRRPLWPAWVTTVPLVVGMVVCIATRSEALMPMLRIYLLLLGIGLIIYMVSAVRQYGRWLRDNYADLEGKEVWQSFVVLAVILLMFGIYVYGFEWPAYEYIIQVCGIVLIGYLLWRVETIKELTAPTEEEVAMEDNTIPETTHDDIEPLLQKYCVDTQLYLQPDLTVTQLAQAIGSNRTYLGQYFSRQDTTYNAYINNLRIHHFINLYREAVAAQRPFTAQQLASDSGYRSYSTFSLAFKQRMGQSVTAWMHDTTA
jgi:AraC-like DNA-binding protein